MSVTHVEIFKTIETPDSNPQSFLKVLYGGRGGDRYGGGFGGYGGGDRSRGGPSHYRGINLNRDVDDFMAHKEARGWLHNWCRNMGFEKPIYDCEVLGNPKNPKAVKFKAKLRIQTRFGEELDVQPEYTGKNKKQALTEVAWIFIETMVERKLLLDDMVPHRETADCLASKSGIS